MKYRMFSRLWQGNDHKTFEIYRKKWCYILLLHQTTTVAQGAKQLLALCYIFLLHQTTTLGPQLIHGISCVISFFYTKPQQIRRAKLSETVVLYLSSTSNHNNDQRCRMLRRVVLYLSSTSNHNRFLFPQT